MTAEQIQAIKSYTGSNYKKINQGLRGLRELPTECEEVVETLLTLLDESYLPKDMVVYRGTHRNNLGPLKNLSPEQLIGKVFIDPGFVSTTKDERIAKIDFRGDVLMKINAPKGARALDISHLNPIEAEVLINAGQKMKILSAKRRGRRLFLELLLEEREQLD